jgi:hypothetical protein
VITVSIVLLFFPEDHFLSSESERDKYVSNCLRYNVPQIFLPVIYVYRKYDTDNEAATQCGVDVTRGRVIFLVSAALK